MPANPGPAAALDVDAVVVGGGPAGLAAATWLGRYRRSVLVVDSREYRSRMVERSHGYLGRDPQRPVDLIARGREEALAYPTVTIRPGCVQVVRRGDGRFDVTVDGEQVTAHRVVLACGVKDALPEVAGFDEHYGASVFHCPACDGYEARDRDVVAIGWDPQLVGFASTLLNWAKSVTVVTNGQRFQGEQACRDKLAEQRIPLLECDVVEFVGQRGDLTGIRLDDGQLIPTSLVFFSIAHQPRTELAERIGCRLDEEGYVVVDAQGETDVPGIYAAGDLVPGLQLVQVAAGSGAVAGVAAAQSFSGERGACTSPDPAPDPAVPGEE